MRGLSISRDTSEDRRDPAKANASGERAPSALAASLFRPSALAGWYGMYFCICNPLVLDEDASGTDALKYFKVKMTMRRRSQREFESQSRHEQNCRRLAEYVRFRIWRSLAEPLSFAHFLGFCQKNGRNIELSRNSSTH